MNCEEVEDLAGAYALDALPPETMREVEAHLASCSSHAEIRELTAVAVGLAEAAPEREPPPALRAQLMEAVRREAEVAVERPGFLAGLLRGWHAPRLAPYGLAAALAVAVAALLAWNIYLQASPDGGEQETLVRTFTDGGVAGGRLLYIEDQGVAVMTVEGLEPLPPDKTYQVWAISGGQPAGIGLFEVSAEGTGSAVMEVDLSGAEVVAITVEPAGGSLLPTSEPVLKAEV